MRDWYNYCIFSKNCKFWTKCMKRSLWIIKRFVFRKAKNKNPWNESVTQRGLTGSSSIFTTHEIFRPNSHFKNEDFEWKEKTRQSETYFKPCFCLQYFFPKFFVLKTPFLLHLSALKYKRNFVRKLNLLCLISSVLCLYKLVRIRTEVKILAIHVKS